MSNLAYQNHDALFGAVPIVKKDDTLDNEFVSSEVENRKFSQFYQRESKTISASEDVSHFMQTESISVVSKGTSELPVFRRFPLHEAPTFKTLQKWEGMVDKVNEDYFIARVIDKTNKKNPEEIVEFDLEEVDSDDLELVEEGAVFYWSIGYYNSLAGQRFRSSQIRFRRLPAWTKRDLANAKEKANILLAHFNLDS